MPTMRPFWRISKTCGRDEILSWRRARRAAIFGARLARVCSFSNSAREANAAAQPRALPPKLCP
jgi:hypothetical protein